MNDELIKQLKISNMLIAIFKCLCDGTYTIANEDVYNEIINKLNDLD